MNEKPNPVPPTTTRLLIKRNGRSITRDIPKPVVLVDTREQLPFDFSRFRNWIAFEKRKTLVAGDYSIEGMEHLIALERKSLDDILSTLIHGRSRFFRECERLTAYRWRALILEASYETIKSPYDEKWSAAHPNGISGSLDALEAKFGIQIIYTSTYKPLAEERAASWLSKHFTYFWLEENGYGRVLQEGDL
jgi:ERCC4-type nuclease